MTHRASRRAILAALATVPFRAQAEPRLVTVIGDSHARGIAFALHRLDPTLFVTNLTVGGTGSWQMPVATDDGSLVIVSAGTVDCGARDPDEAMVRSILRVLGPFATGLECKGRLVYVAPHDRIEGVYAFANARIRALNPLVEAALAPTQVRTVPIVEVLGPDKLHLEPAGYEALAQRCMV